jgi:hypothetical protein
LAIITSVAFTTAVTVCGTGYDGAVMESLVSTV